MAKILVVDDELTIRRMLSYILRQEDHEILTAVDGQEAWSQLVEQPVDIVLLDVAMPNMDGVALLKLIRDDPELHELPVVMLTATKDERARVEAEGGGVDAYLNKVVKPEKLLATLSALLEA
jgi:chemosensory pili system protein ChpA (sensor histidine kinase/response regulator)